MNGCFAWYQDTNISGFLFNAYEPLSVTPGHRHCKDLWILHAVYAEKFELLLEVTEKNAFLQWTYSMHIDELYERISIERRLFKDSIQSFITRQWSLLAARRQTFEMTCFRKHPFLIKSIASKNVFKISLLSFVRVSPRKTSERSKRQELFLLFLLYLKKTPSVKIQK